MGVAAQGRKSLGTEEQGRKSEKRAREDSQQRNSQVENLEKERPKMEKATRTAHEEQLADEKRRKKEEKREKKRRMREAEEKRRQDPQMEEEEEVRQNPQVEEEEKKEKRKKKKKRKKQEDEEEWQRHLQMEEEQEEDGGKGRQHLEVEENNRLQGEDAMLTQKADMVGTECSPSCHSDGDPVEDQAGRQKKKQKKGKKVTFEEHIAAVNKQKARDVPNGEAVSGDESSKGDVEEVWGVRFTPEEDEILKDAVLTYIKSRGWDEKVGLDMIFNSSRHKEARHCWADINLALPHRPRQAVRLRAGLLLQSGNHLGRWSKEEEDLLIRLQEERGCKWKEFSGIMNRHRTCIKEKWRNLKRLNARRGKGGWTQDELQQLSDLVHKSLRLNRLQAKQKKKPDRHLLRDNIAWDSIADTLGTHNHGPCCGKWYYNLQSSLVADGQWANQDDFFLLRSLLESGASAEEEVEWDNLLEHRSGQVCMTRWKQMVKHLGENRTRLFLDKLDILARRYAPELMETSVEDTNGKELLADTVQ